MTPINTDESAFTVKNTVRAEHNNQVINMLSAISPKQVWGVKVQGKFAGWFDGSYGPIVRYAKENLTTKTKRGSLIDELNAARAQRGLAPMPAVQCEDLGLTKSKLEQLIHELDNPAHDIRTKATPPTMAKLLARLNVCRKRRNVSPIKQWKQSRAQLEAAIKKCEEDRSHITVTHVKPQIAEGADTSHYHTSMHKNKVHKALKSDQRKSASELRGSRKAIAEKAAQIWGFGVKTVIKYLEYNDAKTLELDDATRDAIKAWVALPGKGPRSAAPHPCPRGTSGARATAITPHDIATALAKDGRAVRIVLRRIEAKIPKAWRVEGERWGFKPAHKADIIKLVGGK